MNRETFGFAIAEVVGEGVLVARFVMDGIAFELASEPGEAKIDLLGRCFRCLLAHKLNR